MNQLITRVSGLGGRLCQILLACAAVAELSGQPQTTGQREFAVASVKPNKIGNAGGEGSERETVTLSPAGLIMRNISLRSAIRWAYGVRDYQISGPSWLTLQRYDIAANAPNPTSADELKLMMQSLLSERFKLTLHRESKELPVYAMTIGKSKGKLQSSSGGESRMIPTGGVLVFHNYTMQELAEQMATRPFKLDRLVIDQTGLEGAFDFTIKFAETEGELKHTLESMEQGHADQSASIFTILQEQLGLSFKGRKAPVESLVIDRAEKVPTEN